MEAKGQNEAEDCNSNTAPQTKDLDLPLLNLATVEGGFGPVYKGALVNGVSVA